MKEQIKQLGCSFDWKRVNDLSRFYLIDIYGSYL